MEQTIDVIKTAFRVLNAIAGKCDPDPTDIEELRALSPLLADGPPDELACGVIRQMIQLSGVDCRLQ
jgi:hypothetical protein